jgi:hypothetical protein
MRNRGKLEVASLTVLVAFATIGSSCQRGHPIETSATSPSSATTAPPPTVDNKRDEKTAKAAILTVDDLPGSGWRTSTTATTTKGKSSSGGVFDCPDLKEALGSLDSEGAGSGRSVTASAPTFEQRSFPFTTVSSLVVLLPSEQEAKDRSDALRSADIKGCFERQLSHEASKSAAPVDVQVADWKLGKVGDSRVALEITVAQGADESSFELHAGLAFVRVGRAFAVLSVIEADLLDDDAYTIVQTATDKLRDTLDNA